MKNIFLIVVAFMGGLSASIYNLSEEKCSHEKLIAWIDSNKIYRAENGDFLSTDGDIIKVLSDYSQSNISVVNDSLVNYVFTRKICPDSARIFHYRYNQRKRDLLTVNNSIVNSHRLDLDQSKAVLFKMDELLILMKNSFKNKRFDSPEDFEDTGFLIYFANYGPGGRIQGDQIVDRYTSSVILQFAEDITPQTPNEWQVIPNEMYNYGDLKPPKSITNEQIRDELPTSFNCGME